MSLMEKLEDRVQDIHSYTPDWMSLKMRTTIPLFVYDDLKYGGDDHDQYIDQESVFVGDGLTVLAKYDLTEYSDDDFYQIAAHQDGKLAIKGEIYFVHPTKILELDRWYENGHNRWKRESVMIWTLDQKHRIGMKCEIYLPPSRDKFKEWPEQKSLPEYTDNKTWGKNYTQKFQQHWTF